MNNLLNVIGSSQKETASSSNTCDEKLKMYAVGKANMADALKCLKTTESIPMTANTRPDTRV